MLLLLHAPHINNAKGENNTSEIKREMHTCTSPVLCTGRDRCCSSLQGTNPKSRDGGTCTHTMIKEKGRADWAAKSTAAGVELQPNGHLAVKTQCAD